MSDNHRVPTLATDNLPNPALGQAGDTLMRRRQWSEAALTYGRMVERDAASEMKRRLCANLASLSEHRPDVYATLVALPAQQQYAVAATASGKPTIVHRGPGGATVSLSSGHDPLAAAAAAKHQIYGATKSGEAIGLCGVGDGYLLQVLAHNPPALFMDKQQPVFVIEPEPQIVLQCMMIHDYSIAQGPIEQARFHWFVGTRWDERLEAMLLGDCSSPARRSWSVRGPPRRRSKRLCGRSSRSSSRGTTIGRRRLSGITRAKAPATSPPGSTPPGPAGRASCFSPRDSRRCFSIPRATPRRRSSGWDGMRGWSSSRRRTTAC